MIVKMLESHSMTGNLYVLNVIVSYAASSSLKEKDYKFDRKEL